MAKKARFAIKFRDEDGNNWLADTGHGVSHWLPSRHWPSEYGLVRYFYTRAYAERIASELDKLVSSVDHIRGKVHVVEFSK